MVTQQALQAWQHGILQRRQPGRDFSTGTPTRDAGMTDRDLPIRRGRPSSGAPAGSTDLSRAINTRNHSFLVLITAARSVSGSDAWRAPRERAKASGPTRAGPRERVHA